jgi:hypothetical protein
MKKEQRTPKASSKKNTIIIQGQEYIEHLSDSQSRDDRDSNNTDNTVAYGYKSLTITKQGITRPLSKNDDKFITFGASLEEARQEFWIRWSTFCKKAFGQQFTPIYK